MKKAIAAAAIVLACALLCGCESLDERLSDLTLAQLANDENYIDYNNLQESDQLDVDGRYIPIEIQTHGQPDGQIHVTFAENSFLDCSYYWDKELSDPIDTSYCYVDPGECIYAKEPILKNNINSQYAFSGFKVYEYDEYGNQLGELATNTAQEPLTLCIPDDFTGTELSVEPCGVYNSRLLSLADVWYDTDGNANDAGGTWYVNDEVFSKGDTELDAFSAYTVRYEYDPETYYFVSSSVDTMGDTSDGHITFASDSESDGSYLLELRPYTNVTLDDSGKALISASANNQAVEVGKKEVSLGKLKAGDVITLVCKDGYKITCSSDITAEPTRTDSGQKYSFTVPQGGMTTITFAVSKLNSKDISLDVDRLQGWNAVSNWFSHDDKDETILTISNGTDTYNYEELRYKDNISLCETDTLTVKINEQDGASVTVSVNGNDAEKLTNTLILLYDEVNTLSIHVSWEGE